MFIVLFEFFKVGIAQILSFTQGGGNEYGYTQGKLAIHNHVDALFIVFLNFEGRDFSAH